MSSALARGRLRPVLATFPAVILLCLLAPRPGAGYADGPPPAHTGGFGEPSCAACHFGGGSRDRADAEGRLRVDGVPERYRPGKRYPLTVVLEDPSLERAGFELAARTASGDQAGTLEAADDRSEVVVGRNGEIEYAHHTAAGVEPVASHRATWSLVWIAPSEPEDALPEVRFHAAANAANYDASEFGDTPYSAEAVSAPAPGSESPPTKDRLGVL